MTKGYDVRAEIREALADHSSPDPHVIAAKLAENIPTAALPDVVALALPWLVRYQIAHDRRGATRRGEEQRHMTTSGKAAALASNILLLRLYVSKKVGWRFLTELTPDDCDTIAAQYTTRADENHVYAAAYSKLAATVRRQRGAKVVGDLSENKIQEILP